MDLMLASQKADKTIIDVEGVGGYYTWSSSQFPLLSQKKLAAGVLVLHPRGFAHPHYADSSKIAYVSQGECTVGLISPENSKEEVFKIQKGDSLPVAKGVVSWWYNGGDTKLTIVFLGKSEDQTPGEYNYFFLTSALSILSGFSKDFIAKSFHITETEVEKLVKSLNSSLLIIKVNEGTKMPEPGNNGDKEKLVFNLDDSNKKQGGVLTAVTSGNLPVLENVGLSANLVVLQGGCLFGPVFTADSSVQLSYVTKGSGRVQIVGIFGKNALDTKVKEGELFFVPKFFPFAVEADEGGMEFFSVVTSSKQEYGELAGNKSLWEALSPEVLEASLKMGPEEIQSFKSNLS